MKNMWNKFDGVKTYLGAGFSAVGSIAAISIACGVTGGIPLVVAGVCAVGGSALTVIGRLHAGAKLVDQQTQIIDLINQVKVIQQYAKK